mgnify:CR=1 FL=1
MAQDGSSSRETLQAVSGPPGDKYTYEQMSEALQALEAAPFDVVLLDILMPGLDGIDVLRRIKQDPDLRDLPELPLSDKAQLRLSQAAHPPFGDYLAASREAAVRPSGDECAARPRSAPRAA